MASFLVSPIGTISWLESTLCPGEDDGLLEVLDHEGEGAGSEAHGVSAVEYNEGIEVWVSGCIPS